MCARTLPIVLCVCQPRFNLHENTCSLYTIVQLVLEHLQLHLSGKYLHSMLQSFKYLHVSKLIVNICWSDKMMCEIEAPFEPFIMASHHQCFRGGFRAVARYMVLFIGVILAARWRAPNMMDSRLIFPLQVHRVKQTAVCWFVSLACGHCRSVGKCYINKYVSQVMNQRAIFISGPVLTSLTQSRMLLYFCYRYARAIKEKYIFTPRHLP